MYWEPKEIWREGNWDRCYVDVLSEVCVLNLNGTALWRDRCYVDVFWELEEIWRGGNWDRCYVDVFSEVCVLNLNGTASWRQHWRDV